ncbi:MAG: hypothetical protein J7M14_04245, partial [Planctomycetes bacterium]|nr:hypothetical protein [Planctomycetota bacterium]
VLEVLCSSAMSQTELDRAALDAGPWNVSLNGTWQFAPAGSDDYQPAPVPGYWSDTTQRKTTDWRVALKWKFGSYRRDIKAPGDGSGVVLDFEMIRWGGDVLVNGAKAGSQNLGYSPLELDVSDLVKPGVNRLEVVTRGWSSLERYEGKDIQIPVGAGNWFGIKDGGIPGYVTMRLYRGARIGALRIIPRIAGPSCDLTTRISAGKAPWKGRLAARVVSEDGSKALSAVKRVNVSLRAGESKNVTIGNITAAGAKLWWPESPALYRLVVWLEAEGDKTIACVRDDVFGFREVSKKGGRFCLNGRPTALFGSTDLVMYSMLELMKDPERLEKVQVGLFKRMNGTAVRSHMNPLPRQWLDMCDRGGILIFPEFPNFPDVQRKGDHSPYELPLYWKNLQREIRGMIAVRHNHPSIVGWSASNEGNGYGDWERRNLVPFVKSADPTRLVMLSADITDDIADSHNFAGMWWGTQTDFERVAERLARAYPDSIVGNTEYGQFGPSQSWYGTRKIDNSSEEFQSDVAMLRMEQTEALRRLRFDIIMPYGSRVGLAGRTGRYEDASMAYHALRNALSPLGVSMEMSNRHALGGSELTVPVWMMSDSQNARGAVTVRLYLLGENPGFDWDGAISNLTVLARAGISAELAPWQAVKKDVTLTLPEKGGDYFLAAAVRGRGGASAGAVSLRPLRVYGPLPPPKRVRTVGVIERGDSISRWLRARGHKVILPFGGERPEVIVIGEGRAYDTQLRQYGFTLANRVEAEASRMVVLEQQAWDAKAMQENMARALERVTAAPLQAAVMSLFPEPGTDQALGSYRDYARLNGLDHVALRVCLMPTEVAAASATGAQAKLTPNAAGAAGVATTEANPWRPMLVGFAKGGAKTDWALAHRRFGKGEIYACQVPLEGRLDKAAGAGYDPVAERLMAFLIEGQTPKLPPANEETDK